MALLLIGLATYRLARLLVVDDGPGDCFLRLRAWAGCYEYGPDGRAWTDLGRALNCQHCTSLYVSAVAVALWLVWPWALVWLAGLGLASVLFEITR